MDKRKEKECDECGEVIERKHIKKVCKRYLCQKCYSQNRKKFREETIKEDGTKEIIKELDNKRRKEYNKIAYRKKQSIVLEKEDFIPRRYRPRNQNSLPSTEKIENVPQVKGTEIKKKKVKSQSYITLDEKKLLLKQLLSKGFDFEDAKERVNEIEREQRRIRNELREKGKEEEQITIEIKSKQKKMIEDLWKN